MTRFASLVQVPRRMLRFCVSRRPLLGRAGTLLRLAPLQILAQRRRETLPPPVLLSLPGVVRAHVVPLEASDGPPPDAALDRAKPAAGASP